MSWSKSVIEWTENDTAYLSVAFTWDLSNARRRAIQAQFLGLKVKAGGPAVMLMPDYLADVAECNGEPVPALKRHNQQATFTSRGCVRRCPFCAVPKIEGELRELDDWEPAPIVCDNNLLACSRRHFDLVIDRLKPLSGIDFNQGLDARLLTPYHAGRLAELDCMVRLAFDSVQYEASFMHAYETLKRAGLPNNRIRAYVLIGFKDTPEDALYRLQTVKGLGMLPLPMRYQPLDALQKNSYVGEHWTASELVRFSRYWFNTRYLGAVPFDEWDGKTRANHSPAQMALL